jgi:hypothetical protein
MMKITFLLPFQFKLAKAWAKTPEIFSLVCIHLRNFWDHPSFPYFSFILVMLVFNCKYFWLFLLCWLAHDIQRAILEFAAS